VDFEAKLREVNDHLKALRMDITLICRNYKHCLRFSYLPPKFGSERTDNQRQEVALGDFANLGRLKLAETQAYAIGASNF
jgi:hypothetical protein